MLQENILKIAKSFKLVILDKIIFDIIYINEVTINKKEYLEKFKNFIYKLNNFT